MDKYARPDLQDGTWEKVPLADDGLLDIEAGIDLQTGFYLKSQSFGTVSLETKVGVRQIWRKIGAEDEYCELDTFFDDPEPLVMHWYKGNKKEDYRESGCAIWTETERAWIVLREFEYLLGLAHPMKIYKDEEEHYDLIILLIYNEALNKETLAVLSKRSPE